MPTPADRSRIQDDSETEPNAGTAPIPARNRSQHSPSTKYLKREHRVRSQARG